MHKAIYLNALLELAPEDAVHSRALDTDFSTIVRDALLKIKPAWSEQSHLSAEVKRIQPEQSHSPAGTAPARPGRHLKLLLYLEGEQEAPQDFAQLTVAHLRKLLEQISHQLLAQHIIMTVARIEENTSAVDELADEEAAG